MGSTLAVVPPTQTYRAFGYLIDQVGVYVDDDWTVTQIQNSAAGDGIVLSVNGGIAKTPRRTFDFELDFGAPTDGQTDATSALNAALAEMWARGGGTLLCNSRAYKIKSVDWPGPTGYTQEPCTIEIVGAAPPQTVPFCPGSGGDSFDMMLPAHGTIFWADPVAGGSAFFGNLAAVAQGLAVFRNCQILCPGNPQVIAINAGWLNNLITDNVIVGVRNAADGFCSTGKGATEIPEPLNMGSIGIVEPGEGNGGTVQARNTSVYGYGVGVTHSEHFIPDNLTCFKNKVGLQPKDGWHAATYGRVSLYWNAIDLQPKLNGANQTNPAATKPVARIGGGAQIDSEDTDETAAWYTTSLHIDDPYNRLRGRVRWHRMQAAGGISATLKRNGGAMLDLAPAGGLPRSVLDVSNFAVVDSATALPNSVGGIPPTVIRGTWGISGLKAYIAATSASDCIAAWNVGQNSLTVHTRLTTNTSGSRSLGVALNVVDGSNFILVVVDSGAAGTVKIQKVVAGAYTSLATGAFPNAGGTTYDMMVMQSGGRIRVYMDGVLIVSVSLTAAEWSTFSPGVSHGMYSWTGTGFDTGTSRWGSIRFETPGLVLA